MRRAALALMWAGAIFAAACPAFGQRIELGGDPAALESASEMLRLSERYKNVCSELRDNKISSSSPLKEFSADDRFVLAISRFCAQGDFLLEQPKSQSRCEPFLLETKHLDFILALGIMRAEPARRIVIECVRVAEDQRLQFRMLEAQVLALRNLKAGEVYIYFSKLLNGARVDDSEISAGLRLNGVTASGPIIIRRSRIGPSTRGQGKGIALRVRSSTLDRVEAIAMTLDGGLSLENIFVKEDVHISSSTIGGHFDAQGEKFGGRLVIFDSKVTGVVRLERLSADGILLQKVGLTELSLAYARIAKTIELDDTTFTGSVSLEHARVDGAVLVRNSKFTKPLSLNHAVVSGQVLIDTVSFDDYLWASQTQSHQFDIRNVTVTPSAVLTGIVTRNLVVRNTTVRDWFYVANARLNTLDILSSKFGRLDCSDCIIEQYAIVAAEYSEGIRLSGARILGSLMFSAQYPGDKDSGDKVYRSAWKPGSILDLTGVRAQTIQADDVDLRLNSEPLECKDQLVQAKLSGFTFDQFIGGRHMNLQSTTSLGNVLDRNVAEIRNWIRGRPSCWSIDQLMPEKANYQQRFDPQPFETFATALERSGRGRDAVELRIAKREEEIAATNPPAYERFYLEVGRWLVGYGYKNELALVWLVALAMFGTAVFLWSQPPALLKRKHWLDKFFYSLFFSIDRLVPQLIVHGEMSEFEGMGRVATYYFYAHRVIGAIILIYAIAGLTGALK